MVSTNLLAEGRAAGCSTNKRWLESTFPEYSEYQEIDERRKVEQKLETQETELWQILDLTTQLIAVFGPHYRERLFINLIALEYHGLTLHEWCNAAPGALGTC